VNDTYNKTKHDLRDWYIDTFNVPPERHFLSKEEIDLIRRDLKNKDLEQAKITGCKSLE
jgi:hypothetical protein